MKRMTIKDPKGKWAWTVNVATPREREIALRKLGVDPKTSKVARTPSSQPVRIG